MDYSFPIVQDLDVNGIPFQRPGLRQRLETHKYAEYIIEYEVATRIAGGVIETIAGMVFNDPTSWYALADVNKLRDPMDWTLGDVLRIPFDLV